MDDADLDPVGPETLAASQRGLIAQAKLEMDDQAARAREFEAQVQRTYRRAERAEKLAKGYAPVTRTELTRMQQKWLNGACSVSLRP